MTYVTDQTSEQLHAHMKRLKAMPGWSDPLADRLYAEVESLTKQLNAASVAAIAEALEVDRLKLHHAEVLADLDIRINHTDAEVERLTFERDVHKRMRDQHFAELLELRARISEQSTEMCARQVAYDAMFIRMRDAEAERDALTDSKRRAASAARACASDYRGD